MDVVYVQDGMAKRLDIFDERIHDPRSIVNTAAIDAIVMLVNGQLVRSKGYNPELLQMALVQV
jgi:hypothetical protein